jgi:aryl-alcohol dehydrogenase-like predicted oxidoreductase
MNYRRLGQSGIKVSEISLGGWLTLGSSVGPDASEAIVRRAFDGGVNFFDTADVYAQGAGEKALGRAIAGLPRKDLVLGTKCFFPTGKGPNDRGLSRKHVMESCAASLARLGVDYVDLYQCHRYDEETPLEEVAMAMDDLVRQGKTLYWGISHWPAAQIARAAELCRRLLLHRPASNQPPYSMLHRDIEAEVGPTCGREGIGLVVFSPLAQGVLTGKYLPGAGPPAGSRAADPRHNQFIGRYLTPENVARVQRLGDVARDLDLTLPALALAWCLRHPFVSSVITGATSERQVDENLAASGVTLAADTLARIEAILA